MVFGGEREIRTLDKVAPVLPFQGSDLNHSSSSPKSCELQVGRIIVHIFIKAYLVKAFNIAFKALASIFCIKLQVVLKTFYLAPTSIKVSTIPLPLIATALRAKNSYSSLRNW